MTSKSSNDSSAVSTQVFEYLDKCTPELALAIKPSQISSLPQFSSTSPRILSNYINRWKKKQMKYVDEKKANSSGKKDDHDDQKNDKISLDKSGYQRYLKKCLEELDPAPALLKEFREYLEIEGELKQKQAIAHNPEEVKKRIEMMQFES